MHEVYKKPRWVFTFNWPLENRVTWSRWLRVARFRIGYFGPSPATNTDYTLLVFGWPILTWRQLQYHDPSDKERADEYLRKWSECEKRMRRAEMILEGRSMDADTKQMLREIFGLDFDTGKIE